MRAAQLEQQSIDVRSEQDIGGMTPFLDSLKWDDNGLVAAIVQVNCRGCSRACCRRSHI